MTYHHLDLFSGIGGWVQALRQANIKIDKQYFSEVEPYAIEIYKQHYPDAIECGDITKLDASQLKTIEGEWIITGSFPCQDISTAGEGAGINGPRSRLWFEMLRIIGELKPKYVFAENSPALRKLGLSTILQGFAECGYNVRWQNLTASQFGAIHQRRRMWLAATRNTDLLSDNSIGELSANSGNMGNQPQYNRPPDVLLSWVEWQRLKTERSILGQPLIARKNDGLPVRLHWIPRIKALGNAIVPTVAAAVINETIRK